MDAAPRQTASWFRSAPGIRFGLEIAALVLAKLLALSVLYYAFVAAQPRVDTSPDALRAHVAGDATKTGDAR